MKSAVFHFARAVRTNALLGVLFALPAVAISFVVVPDDVGYLLISTTVMVLYVSAKRVNTSRENQFDTEGMSESAQVRLLTLLLVSTVTAVTAQLLTVVALTELSMALLGPTLLPIGIAVLFPVADRRLGRTRWWLSAGGVASWLVFRAASWHYSQDATIRKSGLSLSTEEKILY